MRAVILLAVRRVEDLGLPFGQSLFDRRGQVPADPVAELFDQGKRHGFQIHTHLPAGIIDQ